MFNYLTSMKQTEERQSTENLSTRSNRAVLLFLYFEGILNAFNFISVTGKDRKL